MVSCSLILRQSKEGVRVSDLRPSENQARFHEKVISTGAMAHTSSQAAANIPSISI